jgi:hypothetical protein
MRHHQPSPRLKVHRAPARALPPRARTTNEVLAHLNKDWQTDVRAFDEVHILHMADALPDGIVKQFPNKFA